MTDKIRILIVEDHVLMREGLTSLFIPQRDFEVVGEVGTVREAVDKALELEPDVVLMDIVLPDGDGVEATRAILAQRPKLKIIMLTMHESDELLFAALRSGASGYLLKNTPVAKLVKALRSMQRGEAVLSRTMTSRLVSEYYRIGKLHQQDSPDIRTLTSRELDVLSLLAYEASNKEISQQLVISVNTVKNHVHNILKKLNFKNRREAAMFAQRQGLQDPSGREDKSNSPQKD